MKRRLAIVTGFAALLVLTPAVLPVSALEEADRLFLVGDKAVADRFFPVARRALERFVVQYPSDARHAKALLLLGRTRLELNDAQSALEALARAQSALTDTADVQEAKFWQAEAQFRLKRFSEARTGFDEVFKTDAAGPLAPQALYGLAWSEYELKRMPAAVTAFREFLVTWPSHALAPAATLQLARVLIETKSVADALPLLSAFATKYPSSRLRADAQYLLGWAKYNNGDRQGGLSDLSAFVAANPNHTDTPAARRLLTQGLAKYGDRSQRLEAYKTFMSLDPPTAEGYYEAASIAEGLGLRPEQEAAWKKLRAEFPEDPLTRKKALDMATAAFKQKNWKETVALGTIAAQSDDDAVKAEGWLLVGESELKQKRLPQAAKAFEAVGAVGDLDTTVRFRALAGLGLVREEQKEWKGALAAYEAVANKSPDATLRDWARTRVTAVKGQLPKNGNGTPPKKPEPAKPAPAKPAPKKS